MSIDVRNPSDQLQEWQGSHRGECFIGAILAAHKTSRIACAHATTHSGRHATLWHSHRRGAQERWPIEVRFQQAEILPFAADVSSAH